MASGFWLKSFSTLPEKTGGNNWKMRNGGRGENSLRKQINSGISNQFTKRTNNESNLMKKTGIVFRNYINIY